jgi:hypothetical protein
MKKSIEDTIWVWDEIESIRTVCLIDFICKSVSNSIGELSAISLVGFTYRSTANSVTRFIGGGIQSRIMEFSKEKIKCE